MTDFLVRLSGVGVTYGTQTVLSHIDLQITAGQIISLIGPNGAGKSTLARVILGLVRPTQGTVVRRPGLKMAYTPQRLHLDPILPMTVRRFLRLSQPYSEAVMRDMLAQVGLALEGDPFISELSGGQLQRVLLARALLGQPELLVLDEPTQGVDLLGQGEFYQLIEKIRHSTQCGILLISHDLNMVMAGSTDVVCLHQHICCSGRPDTLRQDPAFIALFGAARYVHHHNHHHDVTGSVAPVTER